MGTRPGQGGTDETGTAGQRELGEVQQRVGGTEQTRVPRPPQREGVLVVHLAAQDPTTPGAFLRGGTVLGWRREGQARPRIHVAHRTALEPFERDAEEDEVDVRIDRP